jgi:hypothetical protein
MILSFLLQNPYLDINVVGGSLEATALHQVVEARCEVAVIILVQKGAACDVKNEEGHTPLAVLKNAKEGMGEEVFQRLVSAPDSPRLDESARARDQGPE